MLKKETCVKFLVENNISTRPKDIKNRKTFSYWELDTIISNRGKSKPYLAIFVEKTKFYVATKIKNGTALSKLKAIEKLVKTLQKRHKKHLQ